MRWAETFLWGLTLPPICGVRVANQGGHAEASASREQAGPAPNFSCLAPRHFGQSLHPSSCDFGATSRRIVSLYLSRFHHLAVDRGGIQPVGPADLQPRKGVCGGRRFHEAALPGAQRAEKARESRMKRKIFPPVTDFEWQTSYCPLYPAWRILPSSPRLRRGRRLHREAVFARHPFWQRAKSARHMG